MTYKGPKGGFFNFQAFSGPASGLSRHFSCAAKGDSEVTHGL